MRKEWGRGEEIPEHCEKDGKIDLKKMKMMIRLGKIMVRANNRVTGIARS